MIKTALAKINELWGFETVNANDLYQFKLLKNGTKYSRGHNVNTQFVIFHVLSSFHIPAKSCAVHMPHFVSVYIYLKIWKSDKLTPDMLPISLIDGLLLATHICIQKMSTNTKMRTQKKKSGKGFSVFYPEYCRVNGLETGQLMDWKT